MYINSTSSFKCDDKGQLLEEYNIAGNWNKKIVQTYENGHVTERKVYFGRGELVTVNKFLYDSKGLLIEQEVKDVNHSANNKKLAFKYEGADKQGNWSKKIQYENEKPIAMSVREIEYY